MKRLTICLVFILLILNVTNFFSVSFIPYQGRMNEIETDNFFIIYPASLSSYARKVAYYAEDIHKKLSPYMKWRPEQKTTMIITDHTDTANGFAIPVYRNTIVLHATPIDHAVRLRDTRNPLYMLILHEYTHTLHMDQIRGAAYFWRIMYGKYYHPVSNTFAWYHEGSATLAESELSSGGRLNTSYTDAVMRRAALDDKIPLFGNLVYPIVKWPYNQGAYLFGARFLYYLEQTYGKEKYDEFLYDLSNDFWPFIFQFVLKFKKVYGKSLHHLWNDWRSYEIELAQQFEPVANKDSHQITNQGGYLEDFDVKGSTLLYTHYSQKDDRRLRRINPDGSDETLVLKVVKNLTFTFDDTYALYIKSKNYPGGISYNEVYSLDLSTKIEKRLTRKARVSYISASDNDNAVIMVSNRPTKALLTICRFEDGKLENYRPIVLPERILFIDKPILNQAGTSAVFFARLTNGIFTLCVLDVANGSVTIYDEVIGKNASWIDDETVSYVGPDGLTDGLFEYDLADGQSRQLVRTAGCVLDGKVSQDMVYYVDYTATGEEIFTTPYVPTDRQPDASSFEAYLDAMPEIDMSFTLKERRYNPMRYLLPSLWGLFPIQNNSGQFAYNDGAFLLTSITGLWNLTFRMENIMPLERFTYGASVSFNYFTLYPDNNLFLSWKIPYVDITYLWSNTKRGYKIVDLYDLSQTHIDPYYPITFYNMLSFSSSYPITNNWHVTWNAQAEHFFVQYDMNKEKQTNRFSFVESVGAYYSKSTVKSKRWDRGFKIQADMAQEPHGILDNNPKYLFRLGLKGRIPFFNTFFFMDLDGGIDPLFNDGFKIASDSGSYSESLYSRPSAGRIGIIDTKLYGIINSMYYLYPTASAFISFDFGFDVSLYKRSHYIYFITLAFKELYLRAYHEVVWHYSTLTPTEWYRGFVIDGTLELGLEWSFLYGSLTFSLVNGVSVGYNVATNEVLVEALIYAGAPLSM